jgi:hypothetical protein
LIEVLENENNFQTIAFKLLFDEKTDNNFPKLMPTDRDYIKSLHTILNSEILVNKNALVKLLQDPHNTAALTKLLTCQDEEIRLQIAELMGIICPANPQTIVTLNELLSSPKKYICLKAAETVKRMSLDKLFPAVVTSLNNCMPDAVYNNGFFQFTTSNENFLYQACYSVLWQYAQSMCYPEFYQAWYGKDFIPSEGIQILEAQNLDFKQLQHTEYSHPLAINILSLKGETEQGAIAQKLCNKIYKHQAVKIPGKPPTVKSDAELQQHLFEIQDKLQRPNLALVLYIKDANGFHEPTEGAIAFCQKLVDPDLGIHIAWITNQPLEQPLKDIQSDPPKLISKIKSWIDEIV